MDHEHKEFGHYFSPNPSQRVLSEAGCLRACTRPPRLPPQSVTTLFGGPQNGIFARSSWLDVAVTIRRSGHRTVCARPGGDLAGLHDGKQRAQHAVAEHRKPALVVQLCQPIAHVQDPNQRCRVGPLCAAAIQSGPSASLEPSHAPSGAQGGLRCQVPISAGHQRPITRGRHPPRTSTAPRGASCRSTRLFWRAAAPRTRTHAHAAPPPHRTSPTLAHRSPMAGPCGVSEHGLHAAPTRSDLDGDDARRARHARGDAPRHHRAGEADVDCRLLCREEARGAG